MKKSFFWILIIILLSIPAIAALLHSGFFQSDDGEWMVIRFSAFHQALRDGQFPVRFLSRLNYGYGYPVANFLYPGFMYFGEIFKFFGFGFVETIKIVLGLSMVGSSVFTYLWLSRSFGNWPAFVGSLLYLYAPYHLFDLYKRGSVGEVLALCIVPFVLWQIERKSFLWVSLGIAFLVLSHNTLSLIFIFLIILYLITRGLGSTIYSLLSIILGLGLSAFFWVPAVFDLRYTVFYKTQISEWNNYFASLSMVGILPILVFMWYLLKLRFVNNRTVKLMFFGGFTFLLLSIPISYFVWEFLPVSFVQFPFRFLSVVILATSFLVAFLLSEIKGRNKFLLGIMLLIVGFVFSFSYMKPQVFFDKGDSYYSTNEATTTVKNEYMPIWVKNNPPEHLQEKVKITNGELKNLEVKSNRISFTTTSTAPVLATINTVYFPGWSVTVDGIEVSIDYKSKGFIQIDVPKGQREIVASFSETPVRTTSDIISVGSALILLAMVFKKRT